jgi:hypothetical protein
MSSRRANSLSFAAIASMGVPAPPVVANLTVGFACRESFFLKSLTLSRRDGSGCPLCCLPKATSAFSDTTLPKGQVGGAVAPLDAVSFLIQNKSFVNKNNLSVSRCRHPSLCDNVFLEFLVVYAISCLLSWCELSFNVQQPFPPHHIVFLSKT